MLMLLHRDKTTEKRVRGSFHALLIMSFAQFALNTLANYLLLLPGSYRWCSVVAHIKYALKPTLLWLVLMISERDTAKSTKALLSVPLLLAILTIAVSCPFGWICYYTDAETFWHEGPLLPVTWIVLLIYMALILLSAARTHHSQSECYFLLLGEGFILLNIINERLFQSIRGMENTVIILAFLVYYLNFCLRSLAEYKLQKEKELNQARVQAMISQIKPHFIYNSLACIAETCHNDAARGEEAVLTFSAYLRSCFQSLTDDGLIPFADELSTIEHYIELEQLQAPGKLAVCYDIRERHFSVPMLAVETLVENAVKHGIRKKHGNGTVSLKTIRDERGIVITIADDGVGFDPQMQLPDETHLGLKNARLRLSSQCGASMQVESRIGQGTEITIIIPEVKAHEDPDR